MPSPNICDLYLFYPEWWGAPEEMFQWRGIFFVATGGVMIVKRGVYILLALVILSISFVGCVGGSKEIKTRCPKCAAYFNSKEGEEEFRWMHGR